MSPGLCYVIEQIDYPGWAWFNQENPPKAVNFLQLITEKRDVIWLAYDRADTAWHICEAAFKRWEWSLADSQQKNWDCGNTTTRKQVLPTTSEYVRKLWAPGVIHNHTQYLDFSPIRPRAEKQEDARPELLTYGNWEHNLVSLW